MAAAKELIRITKGKGIILSSEVRKCMELRAPNDLTNLAVLLGMNATQAKASISDHCQQIVQRGYSNRVAYRGVIDMPLVIQREVTKRPAETEAEGSNPAKKQRLDTTAPADAIV